METIEDILREMRSIKGGQHTNGGRSYEIWRMLCKVADDYADRIEAAFKREIAVEFHRNDAAFGALLDEYTKLRSAFKAVMAAKESEGTNEN